MEKETERDPTCGEQGDVSQGRAACLRWAPSVLTGHPAPALGPHPQGVRGTEVSPFPGRAAPRRTCSCVLGLPVPARLPGLICNRDTPSVTGQGGGTGRQWHIQGDSLSPRPAAAWGHRRGGICPLRKCLYLPDVPGWSLEPPLSLVPKVRSSAPQSLVGGGMRDVPVHLQHQPPALSCSWGRVSLAPGEAARQRGKQAAAAPASWMFLPFAGGCCWSQVTSVQILFLCSCLCSLLPRKGMLIPGM